MEYSHEAILDEVSKATSNLILEEPFYGHFFVGLIKQVNTAIQTMAVGPSGHFVKLHINPRFWREELKSDKLRMGLVKHEILHVVLKHIFRGKDYAHKDLFNIACDLVVNQYIRTDWLPENRIHLGLFPGVGLKPERDADEYYRKLLDLRDLFSELGEETEGGEASPQEREAWDNLKGILGEGDDWRARHDLWEDLEKLPAPLRELLEDQIEEAVMQSVDKLRRNGTEWGKLPGFLRQQLEAMERARKPVLDWRRVLRLFAESSRKTYLRNTLKRPSRRYGTTPGIKVRKRQTILVAVDTSGSIGDEDLAEFFAEVYHIWKKGAEVTVVECDTEIAARYPYRGSGPLEVHGRGGTSFEAPIKVANTELHPDAIVYFTDGYGPVPETPSRCPILWLFTTSNQPLPQQEMDKFPGSKVRMERKG